MSGSLDGSCILAAAGRDWHFKLTVGQWMKLQKTFGNIGPLKINDVFSGEDWTIENVREVVERGLEGGGMDPNDARTTATEIVDGQPLRASYELAGDIIGAAWTGVDELFKKKAAIAAATAVLSKIPTGNGGSATSSAPVSSADSSPAKRSGSASGNISP